MVKKIILMATMAAVVDGKKTKSNKVQTVKEAFKNAVKAEQRSLGFMQKADRQLEDATSSVATSAVEKHPVAFTVTIAKNTNFNCSNIAGGLCEDMLNQLHVELEDTRDYPQGSMDLSSVFIPPVARFMSNVVSATYEGRNDVSTDYYPLLAESASAIEDQIADVDADGPLTINGFSTGSATGDNELKIVTFNMKYDPTYGSDNASSIGESASVFGTEVDDCDRSVTSAPDSFLPYGLQELTQVCTITSDDPLLIASNVHSNDLINAGGVCKGPVEVANDVLAFTFGMDIDQLRMCALDAITGGFYTGASSYGDVLQKFDYNAPIVGSLNAWIIEKCLENGSWTRDDCAKMVPAFDITTTAVVSNNQAANL